METFAFVTTTQMKKPHTQLTKDITYLLSDFSLYQETHIYISPFLFL